MGALTVAAWCVHPAVLQAQAANSGQLLELINGLTPEQQQAMMQQLGGGAGSGATGSNTRARTTGATDNEDERARLRRAQSGNDSLSLLPPALQPLAAGDSVLVEAEVRGEGRSTTTINAMTPAATAAAAAAAQPTVVNGVATPGITPNTTSGAAGARPPQRDADEKELTLREKVRLRTLAQLIRSRSPYLLDRNGALQLPGFGPIPLAGLNEELATKRVATEPALRELEIKLTRLPLRKTGQAALKPYGYDLFDSTAPSNFEPLTDVPVPADYIVGPGDVLSVQLYGNQNRTLRLTVGRDGRVNFPELGPIAVGGRGFNAARTEIEARVSRQMIGSRASVSMGETGGIRVFVMGEAKYPGSYTVSGLASVTGALFAAGGVKPIGSLRDIQLKRQGKTIRHLDLYDLLMQGDTSGDSTLLPGDVILVPPVGATVSVDGEVRRPAIYELKGNASAADLVSMAGGFTSDADTGKAALTRVNDQRQRVVVDVDPRGGVTTLRNGDALRVATLRPTLDSGVTVEGQVFRPGNFAWHEGLRLADVVGSVNELKPDADQHYLLIRRELPPDRHVAYVSADLPAALANPASAANVLLTANDRIMVFDLGTGRERIVKPLMDELKLQATPSQPAQVVNVSGRVKAQGDYPLETGMRVADLVRAGGSLDDAAFSGKAELSRYVIENGQTRRTQVMDIDLTAALRGEAAANVELQAFDGLYIKEITGWSDQEQVTLKGEVRFPGTYPIKRGETLRSVLDRAGGLTDLAFPEGSVFTRQELKEREQEQLDRLTERMKSDLLSVSLMAARSNQAGANSTYTIGQSLLEQLKTAQAVGRLVIDMAGITAGTPGSAADVIMRNGDELVVPKRRQEVTVMGEVQTVTSHLYQPGRSRDDYVALSGGTTRQADRNKIYVVRADGSVVANNSGWLFRGGQTGIHTGDTIVVPLDTERTPALPFWQSVTQIIYNLAVAVSASKAAGIF